MTRDKCFVIMPFGVKPMPDAANRTFDFDKVYRVIIRRAVQEAGMQALRADEQTGSHIIHSDMFRELRDRAVVLADLSLGNPNVYYELGIRHVLSPGGTVLICREGTDLPFDVRLSRVVFYRYDGSNLDWEVVEDIVPRLKSALETAKEQKPDSPVHALLGRVYPEPRENSSGDSVRKMARRDSGADLANYQQIIAALWHDQKADVDSLVEQHGATVFGARALGELCLVTQPLGSRGARVALLLYGHAQYEMSCRLFDKLREEESASDAYLLSPKDLACFGSAVSERDPTVRGAESGISLVEEGLARAGQNASADQRFRLHNSLAGLLMWKWRLTNASATLAECISHLRQASEVAEEMKSGNANRPLGDIAKLHLRLLVALRQRDGTPERQDVEGCINAVLALDGSLAINPRDASYLRWYKAMAHADAGREEAVHDAVLGAVREDALLLRDGHENLVEIGGTQYAMLRRFIADNLPFLNHQTLMGYVSQALQYASQRRMEKP